MATFWSKFKELDRRYPSSSVGTLVGIVFGIVGLWIAFGYEKKPQLRYEILGEWPVYSIREDVPDLVITFKGENIRQQQQTLFVITMRVSNPGSAPITLASFDSRDLPGFEVTHGKIIKLDTVEKSEKLAKTLELTRITDTSYLIQPLILDRDQFFILKLLVLSSESANPHIHDIGNVAGVKKIDVVTAPTGEEHRSIWFLAFHGTYSLQFLRGLGYTIGTIGLILTVGGVTNSLINALRRSHRRRLVRKFRAVLGHEPTKKETAIFDRYIDSGESAVVQLNEAFADRHTLKRRVVEYLASLDPTKPSKPTQLDLTMGFVDEYLPWQGRFLPMLLEQKIIAVKGDELTVDEQTVSTLTQFESFLLANEPEKIKTAKEPFGSDVYPMADITSLPGTRKENE